MAGRVIGFVNTFKTKYVWITGHSLGGALALMCAYDCETKQGIKLTGLMTFGQPRIGDKSFSDYIDDKLKGRYVYFVNQDDVVPRLPEWLLHSGSLVWFKGNEVLRTNIFKTFMAAPGGTQERQIDQLPPLSKAEVETLKQKIRENRMPRRNERGEMVVEGLPIFIKDHLMQYYVEKILKLLAHVLDPLMPKPPIKSNLSLEIKSDVSEVEIPFKKGDVLELKISDPPLPNMVKDMKVKCGAGLEYLGTRYNTEKSPNGGVMVGVGWTCVYVKTDAPGQIELSYERGLQTYQHRISIK